MAMYTLVSILVAVIAGGVLLGVCAKLMQRSGERRRSTAVKQERLMRRWSDGPTS